MKKKLLLTGGALAFFAAAVFLTVPGTPRSQTEEQPPSVIVDHGVQSASAAQANSIPKATLAIAHLEDHQIVERDGETIIIDDKVQQCQGPCQGTCGAAVAPNYAAGGWGDTAQVGQTAGCGCGSTAGVVPASYDATYGVPSGDSYGAGFGYVQQGGYESSGRTVSGVNGSIRGRRGVEGNWLRQTQVPWEQFGHGEYIGPHRSPHVPIYRLRVDDGLEFVYMRTREKSLVPYQIFVGDTLSIASAVDASLTQNDLVVRSDGMVSLSLIGEVSVAGKTIRALQEELNRRYTKFVKKPAIVVRITQGDTPLTDLLDSVDARAGQGGQARSVTVSPDGTIQLPAIGSVPAIGLTLDEIGREVNARYRLRGAGIEVTPILTERAARIIYVVGEVNQAGRFDLVGPTTALQAIALAEGFNSTGNVRQVIVFRRDQNWRLTATKLDLKGALLGKRPNPADEIWLRDSDIVLVPSKPIARFSEAINLYLVNTLYSIFPQQGVAFDFDDFQSL